MSWTFDVDGTLIGSVRSDRLRPGAVELLEGLTRRGAVIVLWSAGGDDYARRKACEHGIDRFFDAFYAKANRDARGRYTVDHFAPEHRPNVFVDDSPIDLPVDSLVDLPVGARVVAVAQFIGGNAADRELFEVLGQLDVLTQ
jgi:phosphoglycolate phosphatase-like HAD superfamily hydrolase